MKQTVVHVYEIEAENQEEATLVFSPAERVCPSVRVSDGVTAVHIGGLSQSLIQESVTSYIRMLKHFPTQNNPATKQWLGELHTVLCETIEAMDDNNA